MKHHDPRMKIFTVRKTWKNLEKFKDFVKILKTKCLD